MPQGPSADRRQSPRHPLATTVEMFHEPSRRAYPVRSVDISEGGMLLYLPVSVPVDLGQSVRLTVGSEPRPELHGLGLQPREATIVRVDRKGMLRVGYIPVGVRFDG